MKKLLVCGYCLQEIKSRGEKVRTIPYTETEEYWNNYSDNVMCKWCEEETDPSELYEASFV